jgi:hypothetical protein
MASIDPKHHSISEDDAIDVIRDRLAAVPGVVMIHEGPAASMLRVFVIVDSDEAELAVREVEHQLFVEHPGFPLDIYVHLLTADDLREHETELRKADNLIWARS